MVTTAGSYTAGLVINAAGAAAEQVAALCGTRLEIMPKRAQMIVSEALPSGTLRNTIYAGANVVAGLDPVSLEFEDMPADETRQHAELENPWQLSSFTQTANGNVLFCGGFGFVGPTRNVRSGHHRDDDAQHRGNHSVVFVAAHPARMGRS